MSSICRIVCPNIDALEKKAVEHAYTLVDERISQLIRERGLIDNLDNRKNLIKEARQSVTTFRPIDGFAIYLHDLNCAQTVQDVDKKTALIKRAIQGIQNWKKIMDKQTQSGYKMNATKNLYGRCEQQIAKIDPNRILLAEIESEEIGPQLKTLGLSVVSLASMLSVSNKVYSIASGLLTQALGPTAVSSLFLTSSCVAFYKSVRSGNKTAMVFSGVILGLQSYYTIKYLASSRSTFTV
jgi:hypothetical protein